MCKIQYEHFEMNNNKLQTTKFRLKNVEVQFYKQLYNENEN